MICLKRMSQIPVKSSRRLLFGAILLFAIVGSAAISATVAGVSLSAVILVLVAFAEAGLIILRLVIVKKEKGASANRKYAYLSGRWSEWGLRGIASLVGAIVHT